MYTKIRDAVRKFTYLDVDVFKSFCTVVAIFFAVRQLLLLSIAFFKELKLVGKFFRRPQKNWKMLCDHALQTHIQSRLCLLHVDNFKIILSVQKQLNLQKNKEC